VPSPTADSPTSRSTRATASSSYSHSGRNAAGIDVALCAKQRDLFVVAVSCAAMLGQESKHSSGKRLADVADVLIDTLAPVEDAIVPVDRWSRPVAGASTVLAMILTHELIARTAVALAARGVEPPTFASPTVPGVTLGDTDRSTPCTASGCSTPSAAISRRFAPRWAPADRRRGDGEPRSGPEVGDGQADEPVAEGEPPLAGVEHDPSDEVGADAV
jgi:hypothetical protein